MSISEEAVKDGFYNKLGDLYSILEGAHESYSLWWSLVSQDYRKDYLNDVFVKYKDFFETTADACINHLIVSLYKLYDGNPKALSIEKIFENAKKFNLLEEAKLNKIAFNMGVSRVVWKKICILRCGYFAHKSLKTSKEEIYSKAELKPNEILELIEVSLIILNIFSEGVGQPTRKNVDLVACDAKKLFNDLVRLAKQ